MREFYLDTTDFDKKFDHVMQHAIPERVEIGLGRAMLNLMRDCVMEVPTVPIKEGWLRGSASIFVQNKLVGVSPYGKTGKALTSFIETINEHSFVGVIGFNTPYAAKMHEGVGFHFSDPSAGPKYLEAKMMTFREQYLQTVADAIKEGA
jgi:hypothetical protein